jgi:hypothetical protein
MVGRLTCRQTITGGISPLLTILSQIRGGAEAEGILLATLHAPWAISITARAWSERHADAGRDLTGK